jgi:hypothetical protein
VHDIVELEIRGVPGVYIASSAFVGAADAQAAALGLSPARVLVPHPIQDRTDDEMRAMADAAAEEIIRSLISGA